MRVIDICDSKLYALAKKACFHDPDSIFYWVPIPVRFILYILLNNKFHWVQTDLLLGRASACIILWLNCKKITAFWNICISLAIQQRGRNIPWWGAICIQGTVFYIVIRQTKYSDEKKKHMSEAMELALFCFSMGLDRNRKRKHVGDPYPCMVRPGDVICVLWNGERTLKLSNQNESLGVLNKLQQFDILSLSLHRYSFPFYLLAFP